MTKAATATPSKPTEGTGKPAPTPKVTATAANVATGGDAQTAATKPPATERKPRVVKPKYFTVKNDAGHTRVVRALSEASGKRAVIDEIAGSFTATAMDDDAMLAFGKSGGDFLDAIEQPAVPDGDKTSGAAA